MIGGELQLFFSSLALFIGIIGGIYFLWLWYRQRTKYRFLFFWAIGLFLMYWLKLPSIIALLGIEFILDSAFSFFFVAVLSSNLLSMAFIYHGLSLISPPASHRVTTLVVWGWTLAGAVAMFTISFMVPDIALSIQSLSHLFNVFYVPLLAFSLLALFVWWWRGLLTTTHMRIGAAAIAAGFIAKIVGVYVATERIDASQDMFWFFSLLSSWTLPIFQSVSIILLVIGFILVYRVCTARGVASG